MLLDIRVGNCYNWYHTKLQYKSNCWSNVIWLHLVVFLVEHSFVWLHAYICTFYCCACFNLRQLCSQLQVTDGVALVQHTPTGISPLMLAALVGGADCLKVLLRHIQSSSLIQHVDSLGLSVLHYAAWSKVWCTGYFGHFLDQISWP